VVWHGDAVLLVRRARAPRQGQWSIPGGMQELGETARQAGKREVREETGLDIVIDGLIDVVDLILPDAKGQVRTHYTLIDFYGHCADESADEGADEAPRDALGRPEPRPGDDADAAVWAPVTELDAYGLWAETRRIITQSRVLKSSAAKSG